MKLFCYVFQLLERALEECGYDMESAIKNLRNLCLGFTEGNTEAVAKPTPDPETGIFRLKKSLVEILH